MKIHFVESGLLGASVVLFVGCVTPSGDTGSGDPAGGETSVPVGTPATPQPEGVDFPLAVPEVVPIPDPVVPELAVRVPLGENHSGTTFDHSDWDALLKSCRTADGQLDWSELARNQGRLETYLKQVGRVDFSRLQRHEQLALLLNVWNATVCHEMVTGLEAEQDSFVREVLSEIETHPVEIGGHRMSLSELEHRVIRRDFADPRTAFALFRGVRGGPNLPASAFTGVELDEQLDAVAADFVMREWKQHPGKMSEYIRWYRTDFGKDPQSLQTVLAGILTRSEAFAGVDGRVVVWLDYDWTLAVPEAESAAAPAAP